MKSKKGDKGFNATLLNLKRGLVTAILVVSVLAMFTAGASATERHVGQGQTYLTIQDAENASHAGDTIIVHDGTYTENVDVDVAHLTIQSQNGADSTTVQAQSANDHVFHVLADYVNISGFTATGAGNAWKVGIFLDTNVDHCNISDNNAYDNFRGILSSSSNNTLSGNNAYDNSQHGIYLHSSSNNTLSGNNAYNNSDHGIYVAYSSNNTLSGNNAYNNSYRGIYLSSSSNNNLTGNTAYNNSYYGIYLSSSSNNNLTGNTAHNHSLGIYLDWSSNNNLSGNYAYNNSDTGIYLEDSSNNNLTNNTANSNGFHGIYLNDADNNNITCNWVQNNSAEGFSLTAGSTGNTIKHNNIIMNGVYNQSSGGYEYQFHNDQSNDVEAKHNYWGAGMTNDTINASIYDWQDDHSKGNVTFYEFRTGPSPCAPIPEAATIVLFSVGLVVLAGYVRVRRKD